MPETTQPAQSAETSTPNKKRMGLNISDESLDTLLQAGVQVGATVARQRQASGRAAARQERIAACGRKPLFGKKKKAAYNKCVAEAQASSAASTRSADVIPDSGDSSDSGGNKTMMYVGIGLGILVVGALGFFAYRKFKK